MSKIILKVVGTSLSNNNLTVYLEDGTTKTFSQGDSRIGPIVTQALSDLGTKGLPVTSIEIDSEPEIIGLESVLKKLEEISNNMVTFSKLDEIITAKVKKVIDDAEETHTLKGIEKIDKYIMSAVDDNKPEGIVKLITRLAKMESVREHSAQDVLDFLNTAHLPITNKGDIIFFKSVLDRGDYCVDCHTGSIRQRPGVLVRMDDSLVDPDRKVECSYGLHVASIEYATYFTGDAMLVGIVEPEKIIAVPHGDTSKVRVSEYLVIYRLSDEDNRAIRYSRDLTDCSEEFNNYLYSMVQGNYLYNPTIIATLTERFANSDNIEYSYTSNSDADFIKVTHTIKPVSKLKDVDEEAIIKRHKVSPKKVNSSLTSAQRVLMYFNDISKTNTDDNKKSIIKTMLDIKRKHKKPWTKLGLSKEQESALISMIKALDI